MHANDNAEIEIETLDTAAVLASLPEAAQSFYRSEAVRLRIPVRQVMEKALVEVAADFGREKPQPHAA